jgi:hypothetical protein
MTSTTRMSQTVCGKSDKVEAGFWKAAAGKNLGRTEVAHFAAENAIRVQVYTIGDLFAAEEAAKVAEAKNPGWTVLVAF